MRSGSTFTGELLRRNPLVHYWFEPLDGVYKEFYMTQLGVFPIDITHYENGSKREYNTEEHRFLTRNLRALLECDYVNLAAQSAFKLKYPIFTSKQRVQLGECWNSAIQDITTLTHNNFSFKCQFSPSCTVSRFSSCRSFVKAFYYHNQTAIDAIEKELTPHEFGAFWDTMKCLEELNWVKQKCIGIQESICLSKEVTAIKVIRLTMETVAYILRENPQVKIIHLLRDPRGIAISRSKIQLLSRLNRQTETSKVVNEALLICSKMLDDIEQRQNLEKHYPGNFLEINYEDLAVSPFDGYKKIYDFLGLSPSPDVEKFILENTLDTQTNKSQSAFGTFRQNSTETALQWKKIMNNQDSTYIEKHCEKLINYLSS